MNNPNLETTMQDVTIEGIRIPRPSRISVMQWMEFWDYAENYDEDREEELERRLAQIRRWSRKWRY